MPGRIHRYLTRLIAARRVRRESRHDTKRGRECASCNDLLHGFPSLLFDFAVWKRGRLCQRSANCDHRRCHSNRSSPLLNMTDALARPYDVLRRPQQPPDASTSFRQSPSTSQAAHEKRELRSDGIRSLTSSRFILNLKPWMALPSTSTICGSPGCAMIKGDHRCWGRGNA